MDSKCGSSSVGHSKYLSSMARSLRRATSWQICCVSGVAEFCNDNDEMRPKTSSRSTKKAFSDEATLDVIASYMSGVKGYYDRHSNRTAPP
mmetsp:Transcript_29873/g.60100  ORF Transcript_29873/g.60100 Transcript_29873/m.60100 type:complete len:91 (-) Transcript_29873:91-363(-)